MGGRAGQRDALGKPSCTVRAAVTSAALDSKAATGAEYDLREKFQPEDFHTAKKFVLVCRSDPALGISFFVGTAAPG